ncbi:MAG: 4Fe-4S dicluster domain-containing protein [Candidatus Kapabacteria bacterium]|nr:4Fe-4S dicluster domain-containing protein [Candidatus Kapabacteria bacterium]
MDRRNFLIKTIGIGAAATLGNTNESVATPINVLSEDRMGVLVDTTVCVGCRNCEWACRNSHNIPTPPLEDYKNRSVFKEFRRPKEYSYTVVNEFSNPQNPLLPIDVKFQCMHCDKPACVSACIVGSIDKLPNGSVVWNSEKCIGCRYCMVACPFQIPAFEYLTPIEPSIRKCDFCIERTKEGKLPACVEICPVEALIYGKRSEIIKIARDKIKRNPQRYIKHIYGEYEVSGTSWIYISSREFDKIGFPKLSNKHAPGVSEAIQHGIFAYFVPPVLFYSMLGTLMWINKRKKELDVEEESNES